MKCHHNADSKGICLLGFHWRNFQIVDVHVWGIFVRRGREGRIVTLYSLLPVPFPVICTSNVACRLTHVNSICKTSSCSLQGVTVNKGPLSFEDCKDELIGHVLYFPLLEQQMRVDSYDCSIYQLIYIVYISDIKGFRAV